MEGNSSLFIPAKIVQRYIFEALFASQNGGEEYPVVVRVPLLAEELIIII